MRGNGRWPGDRVATWLLFLRGNHFIPIISNLPAIGRVLCASQPTGLADRVVNPLSRRSLGERKGLRGRKKEGKEGRTVRTGTVKLSGVAKLFQYFIAATCHRDRGRRATCQEEYQEKRG